MEPSPRSSRLPEHLRASAADARRILIMFGPNNGAGHTTNRHNLEVPIISSESTQHQDPKYPLTPEISGIGFSELFQRTQLIKPIERLVVRTFHRPQSV